MTPSGYTEDALIEQLAIRDAGLPATPQRIL